MFEIEKAIGEWKLPFTRWHYYSDSDLAELEAHLRDVIEEELSESATLEMAFDTAVDRVGSEPRLRAEFELSWMEASRFERYWKSLRAELSTIGGRGKKAAYATARLYSFLVGLLSILFSIVLTVQVLALLVQNRVLDHDFFGLRGYGWIVYTALVVASWFNLTPFRTWSGTRRDWARLVYSVSVQCMLLILVGSFYDLAPKVLTVIIVLLSLQVGPFLWLKQVFWRRETHPDWEELISTRN